MRSVASVLWLAALSLDCSRPLEKQNPALRSAERAVASPASATAALSVATLPAPVVATPLQLELRADYSTSGGQRITAVISELGIEEPLGEAPLPFVCQTTLRPLGSEPLLAVGAKWLDVWCGPSLATSIHVEAGVVTLGKRQLQVPAGRYVSIKQVPQIELEKRTCDVSAARIDVRLAARGNQIALEVPKLRFSLGVKEVPQGSGLRCQTIVNRPAQRMDMSCSTGPEPRALPNPWFQVVSGVLIVEQTHQNYAGDGVTHKRWGIRLPCGQVALTGVDYRDVRYGVRSCAQKCDDRTVACQSKCAPTNDACSTSCYELEGRCYRACGN